MAIFPGLERQHGIQRRDSGATPITVPDRSQRLSAFSTDRALTLSDIYSGLRIHATAASQLSFGVYRGNVSRPVPAILDQPDVDASLSEWIEYVVMSMYIDGNAFIRLVRDDRGVIVDAYPLNPTEVTVKVDRTREKPRTSYLHLGREFTKRDLYHIKFLTVPGLARGLGPIQAAQLEVTGALDARDYGAQWLSDSNMPDGVLTTDQELGPGQADMYKHVWYGRNPDGSPRTIPDGTAAFGANERIRVMGKGLSYSPLMLKPSDVQFLETQQFNTTKMARLLGVPASLFLAAVEGNSQTYSNVEQEWIGYVRFSLMKVLRPMEEFATAIIPRGSVARFKLEALLRSDTKSRYEGHVAAINAGFLTVDEVRAIEGLPPLTNEQRAAQPKANPLDIGEATATPVNAIAPKE
ncbi:phage portal protein [Microbacteriaceae bacterium VKM Ac-2854]|nr:phage portal protein [Microbacteriaceae bacterium VKM Ac-2854]